jgi:glycosyltransferase involved in cell wall biosynthesis
MYSGNHSPANPLDTLLDAAKRIREDASLRTLNERLVFVFIGGGSGKKAIERAIAEGPSNLLSLPYQPLSELRYSLSAGDAHVVSIGSAVVGIVHPCKIYGAMAVSRPVLVLGPRESHVGDLVANYQVGWRVDHGDVDALVRALTEMTSLSASGLAAMGARGVHATSNELSRAHLRGAFCDVVMECVRR